LQIPNPLSEEEQKQLLIKIAETKDKALIDYLIEHNLKLVDITTYKYRFSGIEYDDLFQIGCIGLINAVNKYDISKGYRFSTYAIRLIENEINKHLQTMKYKKRDDSSNTSLSNVVYNNSNDKPITLEDRLESDVNIEKDFIAKEEVKQAYKIISNMDDIDKKILSMHFGIGCENKSQRAIAKELGLSGNAINRRVNTRINRMKQFFNDSVIVRG
jgi:RNA polymerase sporulation-specific sigma factor